MDRPASPPEASSKRGGPKSILLKVAALVVAGACLVWAFHGVDFGRIWEQVERIGPAFGWVLVPFGFSLAFDSQGWRSLLASLGHGARTLRLVSIRLSTEALTFAAPGGVVIAEGVRLVMLQARCGVPVPEGVSSLAARKCLILQGHGLYVGLAAAVGWSFLSQRSVALLGVPGLPLVMCAAAVGLLVAAAGAGKALSGASVATRLGLLLERLPVRALRSWLEGRRTALSQTDTQLGRALGRRGGGWAGLLYLLMWLAEASEGYLLLHLLGVPVSFTDAFAMEAVISVARGLAFFVPAGLGVQDASYVALLRAGGHGAPLELAATFALLKRSRELLLLTLGFILLWATRGRGTHAEAA